MRSSCITKECPMLILDPKSGQSVVVDLTAKHSPAVDTCGSPSPRKVPSNINDFSLFEVRFRLRVKYKNTRQSWSSSSDEHKKNKIAPDVYGNRLHHPWPCAWNDPVQEP
jgi:hypothetical protein